MVKLGGPLMSTEAKGTLADVLTYQGGFGKHRVGKKPLHRDMQSIGQLERDLQRIGAPGTDNGLQLLRP